MDTGPKRATYGDRTLSLVEKWRLNIPERTRREVARVRELASGTAETRLRRPEGEQEVQPRPAPTAARGSGREFPRWAMRRIESRGRAWAGDTREGVRVDWTYWG